MIGIDTNVLVRYIVQDDEKQAALASQVIENQCSENAPGFINRVVLCEAAWVLSRTYGYEKSIIVSVLKQIMITNTFEVDNTEVVWAAINDYEVGPADFSDYLIIHSNHKNNADYTVTFDKKASKHKLALLLK